MKIKNIAKKTSSIVLVMMVIWFVGNAKITLAAGCCVLDTRSTSINPANCQQNATAATCIGANSVYLDTDTGCTGNISQSYCGGAANSNQVGCCITSTSNASSYGTGNCASNTVRSACSGQLFDVTSGDCTKLNSTFCKSSTAAAPAAAGGTAANTFTNPLKVDTLQALLTSLLVTLQGIIVLIAIIMIIVGALMYMFAGVDEKMMENGKKAVSGAVIGLIIVFAAPAFLREILLILQPTQALDPLIANAPTLKTIAERIFNLLLSITGIIGIIGLIVGGIFYLTSYGDEERIKKGKTIITASLTGIVIAMAALVIVQQIANLIS